MRHDGVVKLFLEGANVVAGALGAPVVAEAWNLASVLEDQSVGGLAGHLARITKRSVNAGLRSPLMVMPNSAGRSASALTPWGHAFDPSRRATSSR